MAVDVGALRRAAWQLRLTVVEMIHRAGSGHTGGSLSCAEILTVLYDEVMRIRPKIFPSRAAAIWDTKASLPRSSTCESAMDRVRNFSAR